MSIRAERSVARLAAFGLACVLGAGLAGCSSSPTSRAPEPVPEQPAKADIPRLVQARIELATAYFSRGQNSTALEEINAAIQADPGQVSSYGLRGLIQAAMGDVSRAEQSFQQGLRLSSNDPDLLHNYGWVLCQARRYPEADQQFSLAAQVPGYREVARTLLAQGICQARSQRLPEAERTLARAYELDPASPAAGINLAEVLYRRGEHERARFYVRRVNSVDEQVTAASLWLALRVERALGQSAQVQTLAGQLRSRFPQSVEAQLLERGRFDD